MIRMIHPSYFFFGPHFYIYGKTTFAGSASPLITNFTFTPNYAKVDFNSATIRLNFNFYAERLLLSLILGL